MWIAPCSEIQSAEDGSSFSNAGLNFVLRRAVFEYIRTQAAKVVYIFDSLPILNDICLP